EMLPKDIAWHMIGHVQTNKVKYMAPYVHLIHGVDSEKLLKEIDKQGLKNNRCIDCLLQVYIADETTKFGLASEAVLPLIEKSLSMDNVRVVGLMGMASFSDDTQQIATEFSALRTLFIEAKKHFPQIKTLSMGMSGDYKIAIEQESNMIRVGSKIFGSRH
ncbi:MAG: YggS family pyridoxal phosphate-dependent enzyme, partial [Flavobacteriaceae bacterium]